MKYVRYGMNLVASNIVLVLKKLVGEKIKHKYNSMIFGAQLITEGKGAAITLGSKCYIRESTEIAAKDKGQIILGKGVFVNKNVMIVAHERIEIGDKTTIGPGTVIYDHDHDTKNGGFKTKPISIGSNTWIGANCIILKGVSIGKNVTIGAGTLVNKSIPDNCCVYNHREMIVKNPEGFNNQV